MGWASTTGVFDRVRGPVPEGNKIMYFAIEILDSSGRVFSTTELDSREVAAVLASTGTVPTVSKGSDGDEVFGYIEDISQDGAVADCLVLGATDDVDYAAATEDPDVGNSVQSKGDGSVKQSIATPTITAGQANIGRHIVYYKDTTNTTVRLICH